MEVRFCDEFANGFGWIASERLERAAHALRADRKVWLVDAFETPELEERVRAFGKPAGVIQLLDRHGRDCARLAGRLGVDLYEVPSGRIAESSFELISVVNLPRWREVALWWPAEAVLVCADALGTASYYRARGERLAVHPLLRAMPPRAMSRGLTPRHVLCGHGEGIHGDDAALALTEALTTARRRAPRWLWNQVRRKR